jgi:putative addiction module antidote
MTLKLISVGASTGAILPEEMLAHLKVKEGDSILVVETPEGYLLTQYDPDVEKQLEAGRQVMRNYRDTFRQLGK